MPKAITSKKQDWGLLLHGMLSLTNRPLIATHGLPVFLVSTINLIKLSLLTEHLLQLSFTNSPLLQLKI